MAKGQRIYRWRAIVRKLISLVCFRYDSVFIAISGYLLKYDDLQAEGTKEFDCICRGWHTVTMCQFSDFCLNVGWELNSICGQNISHLTQ